MKTAIIVCTRLNSTRLPNKCAIKINGKSILEHAHDRLLKIELPIIYAYPENEAVKYKVLFNSFKNKEKFEYIGERDNPMLRMYNAAKVHGIDIIIRHTHDKIFIDDKTVRKALEVFERDGHDYLYSTSFIDGTAFEIFTTDALKKAVDKYEGNDIEHITYALKATCSNSIDYDLSSTYRNDVRLLIDYPEDIDFFTSLFACLGNDCTLNEVLNKLNICKWMRDINKMPLVTIYTCAYNPGNYIYETMKSVSNQNLFNDCEYLIVDDHTTDNTTYLMANFAATHSNTKYIRNNENIGLSSSSNVALKHARGKYIIRLDADDYFTSKYAIEQLHEFIKSIKSDVVYPDNYFGTMTRIQKGDEKNHVGGAMFKKLALDHIRFTDGLRNYEGLALWLKAKDILKVSYFDKPLFFYRQSDNSMSKTNLDERAQTKINIEDMFQ